MSKEKFNFESLQDAESVKRYLKALIKAIENRKIILASESQELELNVPELFRIAIRGKKKDMENKVTIKMAWNEEQSQDEKPDSSMIIATSDPSQ